MPTNIKSKLAGVSRQYLARLATALVLTLVGIGLISYAFASQQPAPRPIASAANTIFTAAASHPLDYSVPVAVTIPAIKVQSKLIEVGKNPDGTIQIPVGADRNYAAWYKYSVTPGQSGTSVIEGHLGTYSDPSVFFNLSELRPGEKIFVKRANDTMAVFRINAIRSYPKTDFSTALVYGNNNSDKPGVAELNLTTRGGSFNQSTNSSNKNTIVFSTLLGVAKPGSA